MVSRSQIFQNLLTLKKFRYCSYLFRVSDNTHLVKLDIVDFHGVPSAEKISIQEFYVTEREGYLSAVSKDGSIIIDKLT